jgi:hypothetical protein
MASTTVSRAPTPAPIATLADIVSRLRADPDLPLRRRQEMLAALSTVGRVLGQELGRLPANPKLLFRRLAVATPLPHGVTLRRWANVRSLVNAALARFVPVGARRRRVPFGPVWGILHAQLRPRFRQIQLSGFLRFCAAGAISPETVDAATFAAYRAELETSLRKDPHAVYNITCKTWNTAVHTVPGWPTFQIVRPAARNRWTLPWHAFPASLYEEVQRWLARLSGEDLLEELSFRPVRPSTVQQRDYQLRQTASALVRAGYPAETLRGLADLVCLTAFKATLRHLLQRRGGGNASSDIVDLAQMLKSVARHGAKAPQAEIDAMAAIIRRLGGRRRGLTAANRSRLRPLDDPATARMLVSLPQRLLTEAKRVKPQQSPRLVQTAVAIELLLMAPVNGGENPRINGDG